MRTIEEIEAQLIEAGDDDDSDPDQAWQQGLNSGFEQAMKLINAGHDNAAIVRVAEASRDRYQSRGNDGQDAYQTGRIVALLWSAEQFDWNEDGEAINRDGSPYTEG